LRFSDGVKKQKAQLLAAPFFGEEFLLLFLVYQAGGIHLQMEGVRFVGVRDEGA
jgi:hypothetical protein